MALFSVMLIVIILKKFAKRDVVKWLKFAKKESSKIAKRGFPLGNFFAVIAFYRSLLLIFLFVA